MLVVLLTCFLLNFASGQDEEESTEKPYQKFKGCRFDRFEEFPCLNRYDLVDFANNNPRSFENLRLKMYFSDKRPIICLHNDENQLTFGETDGMMNNFDNIIFRILQEFQDFWYFQKS